MRVDESFHLFDRQMIEYAGKAFPDVSNLPAFPERKKNLTLVMEFRGLDEKIFGSYRV